MASILMDTSSTPHYVAATSIKVINVIKHVIQQSYMCTML